MFKVSRSSYSAIPARHTTTTEKPSSNRHNLGSTSRGLLEASEVKDKMMSTSAPSLRVTTAPNTTVSGNAITIDMEPMLTGLVPSVEKVLHKVYRDMYYNEAVAGCAVDLISTLPFSEFSLGGLASQKGDMRRVHRAYEETLERLNLRTLLPEMSVDYLVLGRHCSSLLYNKEKKSFTDVLPHDVDNLDITPLPFYSQDPIINVKFHDDVKAVLSRTDSPRIARIREHLGKAVIDKITSGSMELDPLSTIFIPRRTFSKNDTGTSYLRRLLPIYLIEKNLYRGTLVESARRQRGILHVSLGDGDQWIPTVQDLEFITELFMGADSDPLGAIIATRTGIQVEEHRQGGDFWKVSDYEDTVLAHKLRALGISEAFLSGDATYACVTADTYVQTEFGLYQIGNIADRRDGKRQRFTPMVNSRYGLERCAKWQYSGKAEAFELTASTGAYVSCTGNHRLITLQDMVPDWDYVEDLGVGDYVALQTASCTRQTKLPITLSDPEVVPKGVRKEVLKPRYMTPELAYLMATILAEGNVTKGTVSFGNGDQAYMDRFSEYTRKVFGIETTQFFAHAAGTKGCINGVEFTTNQDHYAMRIGSRTVAEWFIELGCDGGAKDKRVPDVILQADEESQLAFLAAYLEGDGHIHKTTGRISWISISKQMRQGIFAILQSMGLNAHLSKKSVSLYSRDSQVLYSRLSKYLVTKSFDYTAKTFKAANKFGIPSAEIRKLLKDRMQYFNRHGSFLLDDDGQLVQIRGKAKFSDKLFLYDAYDDGKYDLFLEQLEQISKSAHAKLMHLFKLRYTWVPITKIRSLGVREVYDLSMAHGVEPAYVANGFISHNTGDSALSVFIDTIRSFRDMMTRKLFYNKLFPLISLINGFTTKDNKISIRDGLISEITSEEALSRLNDNSKLFIPSVHWNKQLKPEGDTQYIELLNSLTEKGVPVPLRALAAAGGMDLDELIRQQDEDIDVRKRLAAYQKRIAELTPKSAEDGGISESADVTMNKAAELVALASTDPTGKTRSAVLSTQGKIPLLSRDFSHTEPYRLSKTGKALPVFNRPDYERRANKQILNALKRRPRS